MQGLRKIQCAVAVLILNSIGFAGDWPQWGHDVTRNMSAPATGLPDSFNPGEFVKNSEEIDLQSTENIKWIAKLGSQSYGNPTVAGGRVFVGTNNESPRDPKHRGDRGVVMCFDEQTGKFLWQLTVPKLGSGKVNDWEYLGICSSPTVDGDRVYVVTNRCEVVCLDVKGLADGNDGPFEDEGKYMAGSGKPPIEPGPTDADIIWRYDMREELGVFPHNIASSAALVVGDVVFATTSNGQDWSHVNIPNPMSPTLIALDKKTGELAGEEGSGISQRLFHCNWSSPAHGTVNGKGIVMFGAGDGFCYGFDPNPVEDDEGFKIFREIWRYDCNPPAYRARRGKPIRYVDPEGPSEIIATPVFYKNRVYVAVGQDPEHGEGVGMLSCIDATKTGDISQAGAVWQYKDINRSISTVSIVDGLVYAADYAGDVHCLDADSGRVYWVHDTKSHIWGSTLVADGKVYIGNEDGILTILQAGKEHKLLKTVEVPASIYSSLITANGVVYLATHTHLYAIQKGK